MIMACLLSLTALSCGCSKDSTKDREQSVQDDNAVTTSGRFVQKNTKANLIALFKRLHAFRKAKNDAEAARLIYSLLPDKTRIKKGLKAGISDKIVDTIAAMFEKFGSLSESQMARLIHMRPEQTEIRAHGATTEQIAANKRGTVVFEEFPGGAVKAAKYILRPKTKFYEVEFVRAGEKSGMKYHLFFWDGKHWTMLGPVWRANR
jgi:hypothetical protein